MVGSLFATVLSRLTHGQLSIFLIEQGPSLEPNAAEDDPRAITLSYSSYRKLAGLGLWQSLADRVEPITAVQISEPGSFGMATLRAEDCRTSVMGYVVELRQLASELFLQACGSAGVVPQIPRRVVGAEWHPDRAEVVLDNGEKISGALLVLASGSKERFWGPAPCMMLEHDYCQQAIVTTLATERPHMGRAFEILTSHGPLTVLPLRSGRSAVVWCRPRCVGRDYELPRGDKFLDEVQQAIGVSLGSLSQIGPVKSHLLKSITLHRPIGHRRIWIGNAAQMLHPIAAQGFNLAIRDIFVLADVLVNSWRQSGEIGSYSALQQYLTCRASDRRKTISLTNRLLQLLGAQQPSFKGLRSLGLAAINRSSIVRRILLHSLFGENI